MLCNIGSVVSAEEPIKYMIMKGEYDGPTVDLIDDSLFVSAGLTDKIDTTAREPVSMSQMFDIKQTDDGALLILRPSWVEGADTKKKAKFDGYYLTADYSRPEPALKFTKEIADSSYWDIPVAPKNGPIANRKKDDGKPVYLTVSPEIVQMTSRFISRQTKYHPITLSFDPSDKFRIRRIMPYDDAK
jgi:hypothetical protein